jgi:hypothetical protein
MKKYRLLVVLLRTNALARKPAQKLKLTHQSANRFRRPYQVDYIASLQAHSKRRLKPIHQSNRLTGRTGITQPTHSLVINIKAESKIFKQTFDMNLIPAKRAFDINTIPSKRYKDKVRSITANRAFQGMAGLAVLYPSVVDYIVWSLKTL